MNGVHTAVLVTGVLAHRADRAEPHLARTVGIIRSAI
ncbi:hypothetical protein SAURM35S_04013 [Streptomyces aurantiogriseus]